MRPFRPLPWLLFLLLSAAPAVAQRPQVFLLNGGPPGMGGLFGPSLDRYSAQFEQALLAGFGPMKLASLAQRDLTTTYGVRFRGWDPTLASERYRAAAFLATQIPAAKPDEARRLQAAIWNLMGSRTDVGNTTFMPGGNSKVQWLVHEALLNANTVDAEHWTIASDVQLAGRSSNELLVRNLATDTTVVPEPEVILLLASGLLALGAVVYFRGMVA